MPGCTKRTGRMNNRTDSSGTGEARRRSACMTCWLLAAGRQACRRRSTPGGGIKGFACGQGDNQQQTAAGRADRKLPGVARCERPGTGGAVPGTCGGGRSGNQEGRGHQHPAARKRLFCYGKNEGFEAAAVILATGAPRRRRSRARLSLPGAGLATVPLVTGCFSVAGT